MKLWHEQYFHLRKHRDPYFYFIAWFLFETGIRPNQIFHLPNMHRFYSAGVLEYHQDKTGILRTINVTPGLLSTARFFRRIRGNFATVLRNYVHMKKQVLYCVAMPYRYCCAHKKLYYFRYLFVLYRLQLGYNLERISHDLGHNELSTVSEYVQNAMNIEEMKRKKGAKNE